MADAEYENWKKEQEAKGIEVGPLPWEMTPNYDIPPSDNHPLMDLFHREVRDYDDNDNVKMQVDKTKIDEEGSEVALMMADDDDDNNNENQKKNKNKNECDNKSESKNEIEANDNDESNDADNKGMGVA